MTVTRLGHRRRVRRNRLALARALPGFVVLLHVAVSAGAAPRTALALAAKRSAGTAMGVVTTELASVLRALDLGADLTDALAAFDASNATDPGLGRVLDLLRRSEHDGGQLDVHVELLLHDLRRERAHELDVAAQRLTVALLFPLVLLILPAFVVLAVIPLVIDILGQLPS